LLQIQSSKGLGENFAARSVRTSKCTTFFGFLFNLGDG